MILTSITTECILQIQGLNSSGYGAHRRIYEQYYGKLPDNFDVHHKCRNTSCINPEHFEALPVYLHRFLSRKAESNIKASISVRATKQGNWLQYDKRSNNWYVIFRFRKEKIYLGCFKIKEDAKRIAEAAQDHLYRFLYSNRNPSVQQVRECFGC